MKVQSIQNEEGFTIIELLIATTVFTLILILLTTGVLAVTRLYEKGIIESHTQTATRNILDDITNSIQFSGASYAAVTGVTPPEESFCIGGTQFSYQLNQAVNNQTTPATHALLERNVDSTGCQLAGADPLSMPTTGSTELLSSHMSLNNLDVNEVGSTSLYCVSIRVIYYGDPSLLTPLPTTTTTDSCGNPYKQLECNGALSGYLGGQFCSVSGLDTYVQERAAP
jgi:hypothetical protein